MRKINSIWMMTLILLIPLYSSSALAASLEITHVSGTNEVGSSTHGYRLGQDSVVIHALVDIEPETLTPTEVAQRVRAQRFGAAAATQQDANNCVLISGTQYNCTFTLTSPTVLPAGHSEVWTVGFYPTTSPGTGTSTIDDANITVDGAAPNATVTQYPASTTGSVTVSYDTQDFLIGTINEERSCAGVDAVAFRKDGVTGDVLATENPVAGQNEFRCILPNRESTFTIDSSHARGIDKTICAVTQDRLGNVNNLRSHCFELFVDTTDPTLDSFDVLYAGGAAQGEIVDSAGTVAFAVNARVTIEDLNDPGELQTRFGLNPTDLIEAEFPNLNTAQTYDRAAPDECIFNTGEGSYDCFWNNLMLQNSAGFVPTAEVFVRDGAGNNKSENMSADQVNIVDEGPVVTNILSSWGVGSDVHETGLSYLGNENIITVLIDSDAPVEHDSIALDLRQLGSDYNVPATKSDICSNSGTKSCIFNLTKGHVTEQQTRRSLNEQGTFPNDGDNVTITYIPSESTDALGNPGYFGPERPIFSKTFTIDTSDPLITSYSIERIPGPAGTPTSPDLVLGDRIRIIMDVEDISQVRLNVNLSGITDQTLYDTTCTMISAGMSRCEIETQPITLQAYHLGDLEFTVTDRAGNVADQVFVDDTFLSVPIEVLERIDDVDPDFWTIEPSDIECSGPYDRVTTSLAPLDVYCKVVPQTTTPEAEGYSISTIIGDDCFESSTGVSASAYLEDAEPKLINVYEGTKEFYTVLRLSQDDFTDFETLEITCPVSIHSRINTSAGVQYVANPEEEMVNLSISFFNNPLGTYGGNVLRELEGTRNNDFLMEATIISDAKKILDIAASICNIVNLYNQIVGAVASVGATAGVLGADVTGLEASIKSLQIGNMNNFLDIGAEICEYGVGCKHSKEIIQDSLWQAPGLAEVQGAFDATGVNLRPQPKDSLILSIGTACAPGIVNNLEKFRAIECGYSRCVLQSVREGDGAIIDDTIPALCKRERDYQNCKFVTGEIFNVLPYTQAAKQVGEQLEQIFADPISLGFSVAMITCHQVSGLTASSVCIITATVFEWTSIVGQVNDFDRNFDFDSITGENECQQFKEEYDEVFG